MFPSSALKRLFLIAAGFSLALLLECPLHAQLSEVTSSSALTTSTTVDWNYSDQYSASLNFSLGAGQSLNVSIPSGQFIVYEQPISWPGNLGNNNYVLLTGYGSTGPITLTFTNPIFGIGTQFATNLFGTFVASIQAFDASGNSLGSFSENGDSTETRDDSAIFLGVSDSQQVIKKLVFSTTNSSSGFAINMLDIQTIPEPEPGLTVFMGSAVLGFLFFAGPRRVPDASKVKL